MRARFRSGVWLAGAAVALGTLALPATPGAEPFRAGAKELALVGGYSLTNTAGPDVPSFAGYHLIPHVGYFLTDERGPGALRGNLELLSEPTLLFLEGRGETTTVFGFELALRWVFAGWPRVRPYLEAGVGALGGELQVEETSSCRVGFALQAGVGALLFLSDRTAITAGYRFHHLSNAQSCPDNPGLNSNLFMLGVSHFFP